MAVLKTLYHKKLIMATCTCKTHNLAGQKYHFILAQFILEMGHPSWMNLHTNWASNDSSPDNLSVYKYRQTDGSSVQTGHLDNSSSSMNYLNSQDGSSTLAI